MIASTARMHYANSLTEMWRQFGDPKGNALSAAWKEAEAMSDEEAIEWAREAGYTEEAPHA